MTDENETGKLPGRPVSPSPSTLPNKFAGLTREQKFAAFRAELVKDPQLQQELAKDPQVSLIMMEHTTTMKSHRGPLPSPEDFAEYEKHCNGSADRIIKMAESAQQHGQAMDAIALQGNLAEAKLGQKFGFILGALGLLGGVTCILLGHDWAGVGISGGSLVALVTVFLKGRKSD